MAACGDDGPGSYVVGRSRDDGGVREARGLPKDAGAGPRDEPADDTPVSSTRSVVVNGEDEDAGADVGAADPAPGVETPGEHGCVEGPTSSEGDFTRELGGATSTILTGNVVDADGDGRFYVESADGQSLGGAVETSPDTGAYKVEVPLFCGTQVVKLVWSNGACDLVLVYEITTEACETDIRVTLTWDALGRDFELHLVRAGGRINDDVDDCTWTSCIGRSPDWGVIGDAGDDPTKDVDNTGAFGPENILLERAPAGSYTVMVEHWGSGDPGADGEVTINLAGQPPFVVRIFNLHPQGVFTMATIRWPSAVIDVVGEFYDCSAQWSGGCAAAIP
jgi:uncharacterized protein YfaP (DUF2135 family)